MKGNPEKKNESKNVVRQCTVSVWTLNVRKKLIPTDIDIGSSGGGEFEILRFLKVSFWDNTQNTEPKKAYSLARARAAGAHGEFRKKKRKVGVMTLLIRSIEAAARMSGCRKGDTCDHPGGDDSGVDGRK